MKKHLLTVVLALVLTAIFFTVTIAAVDTQAVRMDVVAGTGVDLESLAEGDTFDVYVTVPLTLGNTNQYYYRGYDLGSANKTFNATNAKLTEETITLGWTSTDMYVSNVEYVSAKSSYATATSLDEAGTVNSTMLYYAFAASTPAAAVGAPTVTGSGDTTATALTISYSGAFNGYMININKVSPKPAAPTLGVIAKVTFTVAKESGAEQTIGLTNSHKISGESESYSSYGENPVVPTVSVTIKAGCLHPEADRNYDHADALAKNKAATCYSTGEQWFYCNNCGKLAKEDVAMIPHSFTKYTVETPATCWGAGVAKWYCANDGCTEYDHTQGNDGIISLAKLTHEAGDFTDTATCTEDGYAFYTCTKCGGLSADGNTFYDISYVPASKTFINNKTSAPYTATTAFVSYAKGHDYVQDEIDPDKYVCSRCGDELIVDEEARFRYVSQDGGGDGKSQANPTTLRTAFDELGVLPEGVEATIYLVGSEIAFDTVSAINPACDSCFEESKHANHITITSADPNNKTTLKFNESVKFYFLYGPTTFENVKFASTVEGKAKSAGDSADSGGVSICARGFALVMGEGLEMLSCDGTDMHVNKNYLDNVSIDIPDVKMYIAGGFYAAMIYPGADPQSVQTDVTILSGKYWNLEGLNRGGSTSYLGAHATITLAGGTFANIVPTTSMSNASFAGDDNIIDIHYMPGDLYTCAFDYRSGINAMTGKITVNRLFHNGAEMLVGDFMMGSEKVTNNTRVVNCYWDDEMAEETHVTKFIAKGKQHAATYNETGTSDAFPAYCVDYRGGHDYEDGCCTFCGIIECDAHEYEQIIVTPSTCSTPGTAYDRCVICGEKTAEYDIPAGGNHDLVYTLNGSTVSVECAFCGQGSAWDLSDYADRTVYVRDIDELDDPDAALISNGATASAPLYDLAGAMQIAAAMDGDATVALVGDKYAFTKVVATSPACKDCFEEPEHANHITVTSANKNLKTTLEFNPTVKFYFLYGPTTFENLKFGSTIVGTGSSGGVAICARGFKLVMGKGLEMLSTVEDLAVSKTDGGLDSVSLMIPDIKMYIAGGFLGSQIYPGANTQTVQTDVTVESGIYWCLEGLNRSGATTYNGAHGNITLAGGTFYNLVPTTAQTGATFIGNDNVVDIHYVAGAPYTCALDYRVSNQAMTGVVTVNRFFYTGAKLTVGDFMMGSKTITNNTRIVNCYWENGLESEKHVAKFVSKGVQYSGTYAEVNHNGTFAAYCIDTFGAHDFVGGVCTRCGIMPCKVHTYGVVSETPATCVSDGYRLSRCTACYEYLEEVLTLAPTAADDKDSSAHDYHFDITDPSKYTCVCTYCGKKYCTVNPQAALALTDNTLYVSDNGKPWGGFSPALPLNDYQMALQIAASCGEPEVTVCVVGTISINGTVPFNIGATFLEPEHSGTHITVCGYDTNPNDDLPGLGVLFFDYNQAGAGYRSVYGLNGDTTFDTIEFSSKDDNGNIYLVARHNRLVLGENMTADFMRSSGGTDYHGGNVILIGGCYTGLFGSDCTESNTYLEVHSGVYRAIYGGSLSQTCGMNAAGSSVELKLLGNIFARELIVFGSRSAGSGTLESVDVMIDGNVQAGAQIIFGSYNNDPKVGSVLIRYRSGFLSAYAFGSAVETSADSLKAIAKRILGSNNDDNNFKNQIDQLKFYYNGNDQQVASVVKSLQARYRDLSSSQRPTNGYSFENISMDCINGQQHTPAGDPIAFKPSTCTDTGYEKYRCDVCDAVYTVIIEKQEHNWKMDANDPTQVAWEVVSEANCTTPEIQRSYCVDCGYAEYKMITGTFDATGDGSATTFNIASGNVIPNAVTAVKLGSSATTAYTYDKTTGDVVFNTAPKNKTQITVTYTVLGEHSYEDGVCRYCGKAESLCDEHDWDTDALTVENNGCISYEYYPCKNCSAKNIVKVTGSHDYGKYTVTTEPTATTPGLKTRVCKDCGKVDTAILYATDGALNSEGVAVDGSGKTTDIDTAKLSKRQKDAVNAVLSMTEIGTEVKYAYKVNANGTATFSIPLPEKYADLKNVKVMVKGDDGKITEVQFTVDRGYIVFTY